MLLKGDCRQQLATLPDNSVHAIITDPPYELGFMGKTWDSTGIAYNVEVWTQCLRVLKPGGHLLAFGGSRTYHRLACAIEDAGFEIRDQIMWVYGSGFPKSLDVSKAIDKQAGAERQVVGNHPNPASSIYSQSQNKMPANVNITAPSTDAAKQWDGWGTALKPAHEPIVLARKPLNGTVANNVLTHGVGALNIDESRITSTDNFDGLKGRPIQ
jgi:site-specific DNA-methyltransferase (adenine-specific)